MRARELWENRSVYIAPLALAAVALLGFLIATIGRAVATADPTRRAAVLTEPSSFAAMVIMAVAFIVGVFYSLEALHGERRDRSILFWKSLPVSDLITVLSKASIPTLVLPLLTFAIVAVTQFIMLLMSSAVLAGSGLSVAALWEESSFFHSSLMLLYHMLTVHVLWYAPIYGWLLLVSAWARRAPFLWAFLPLLAIGAVEKIAFNTSYFAAMLQYRMTGPEPFVPLDPLAHLSPGTFLSRPGLWIGLAVAEAFLFAAVRLRRHRGPM